MGSPEADAAGRVAAQRPGGLAAHQAARGGCRGVAKDGYGGRAWQGRAPGEPSSHLVSLVSYHQPIIVVRVVRYSEF